MRNLHAELTFRSDHVCYGRLQEGAAHGKLTFCAVNPDGQGKGAGSGGWGSPLPLARQASNGINRELGSYAGSTSVPQARLRFLTWKSMRTLVYLCRPLQAPGISTRCDFSRVEKTLIWGVPNLGMSSLSKPYRIGGISNTTL